MSRTVAIVGCLDTKGQEVAYLRQQLSAEGCAVHVIDVGILDDPDLKRGDVPAPETSSHDVAEAAGTTLAALRETADRGHAVRLMSAGAATIARRLHEAGAIQGVLAAGGSANTNIATAAMRALPIGVPKVMVSTLAAGNVAPYVGTCDITMMYSVVDIAGLNRISRRILGNAARAVAGMVQGGPTEIDAGKPVIAATMFGVTTPCVTEARKYLEAAGYEVVVFHATGSGGRAMESLIADGFVAGVLDLTTTEIADEVVGGILSAGAGRLTAAAAAGIPQVVSIGAVDMVNFGPRETVPSEFGGRLFYEHNPTVTLMRTTAEENSTIGSRMAARLAAAPATTAVLAPTRGVSSIATAGEVFHDPDADRACIRALTEGLEGKVHVQQVDLEINAPDFARLCAETLLNMLSQ